MEINLSVSQRATEAGVGNCQQKVRALLTSQGFATYSSPSRVKEFALVHALRRLEPKMDRGSALSVRSLVA